MLRSRLARLTPEPASLQLGGATGFVLWPAIGAVGHTWPVTVQLVTKRGDVLELLARPGVWYGLGSGSSRLDSARAFLPAAAAAALYQLDLADGDAIVTPGPTP